MIINGHIDRGKYIGQFIYPEWGEVLGVKKASCELLFIRVHENLVEHSSKNISVVIKPSTFTKPFKSTIFITLKYILIMTNLIMEKIDKK